MAVSSELDMRQSVPLVVLLNLLDGKAHLGELDQLPQLGIQACEGLATLSRTADLNSRESPAGPDEPPSGTLWSLKSHGGYLHFGNHFSAPTSLKYHTPMAQWFAVRQGINRRAKGQASAAKDKNTHWSLSQRPTGRSWGRSTQQNTTQQGKSTHTTPRTSLSNVTNTWLSE